MSQLRYSDRSDSNSADLDGVFRALGASVEAIKPARRGGLPDRLIGLSGVTGLVEYKNAKGVLNDRQKKWISEWKGAPVYLARTKDDVIEIVKSMKARALLMSRGWTA